MSWDLLKKINWIFMLFRFSVICFFFLPPPPRFSTHPQWNTNKLLIIFFETSGTRKANHVEYEFLLFSIVSSNFFLNILKLSLFYSRYNVLFIRDHRIIKCLENLLTNIHWYCSEKIKLVGKYWSKNNNFPIVWWIQEMWIVQYLAILTFIKFHVLSKLLS